MENEIEVKYKLASDYYYGTEEKEKDYEKAFEIFNELVKKYNHIKAKFKLAEMYFYGKGINQNYKKAFELFNELSGNLENVYDYDIAKSYLARMYYDGKGVEKDYKKAFELFEEILKESVEGYDFSDAEMYVAEMCYDGRGVEPNYERAFELFSKLENEEIAKLYLVRLYYYGKGVAQDYKKAYEIFKMFMDDKLSSDYEEEEDYYYTYNGKGKMIENYEKVFEIFNKLAEMNNDKEAKIFIARMYYYGKYVKRDAKKAFELFNEIAEYDADAREFIRDMYNDTGHIEKNSMSFNFWEEVMKKTFEIYDYLKELGYEDREEQQNMTMDIIQAIEDNQNIIIEARCWHWKILCIFNTINVILYQNE